MSFIRSIKSNYRYAAGLRRYLRQPADAGEARAQIERRLATRVETFLALLERAVYRNPESPYFKLLDHVGFGLEDVRRLVEELGLEGALERLYEAGVYITQDELKGRRPIERGSLVIQTKPSDFDSPTMQTMLHVQTSGSTGQSARLSYGFEFLKELAVSELVIQSFLALDCRPTARWKADAPSMILRLAKTSGLPDKDFTTTRFHWTAEGVRSFFLRAFTLLVTRLSGYPVHRPQFVPRDRPQPVVSWLAKMVAQGRPGAIVCAPSSAIRICAYAKEHGLDLTGTLFQLSGEPYTPAKAAVIGSVGATARVRYSMQEPSGVGEPCTSPSELDEVHFEADKLVLIQRDKVTTSGAVVPAIVLTGLLPALPKLMLNVESGDYARVFQRDCGCPFEELGFTTHLSNIRSYEKLTSEGVTFLGTLLYELVEVVLPARFGGTIGDYQLAEEEDGGVLRVSVVVSKRVGEVDEAAVVATVLANLRSSHELGGELMAEQWRQAGTLRVVRREPFQTRTMKVPPLHAIQSPRIEQKEEGATVS